jgi:hypothetical protein
MRWVIPCGADAISIGFHLKASCRLYLGLDDRPVVGDAFADFSEGILDTTFHSLQTANKDVGRGLLQHARHGLCLPPNAVLYIGPRLTRDTRKTEVASQEACR